MREAYTRRLEWSPDLKSLSITQNGRLHSDTGPAYIEWYDSGEVERVLFYQRGWPTPSAAGVVSVFYSPEGNVRRAAGLLNGYLTSIRISDPEVPMSRVSRSPTHA